LNAPMEVDVMEVVWPTSDERVSRGPRRELTKLFTGLFDIYERVDIGIRKPDFRLQVARKAKTASAFYRLSGSVMELLRPLTNLRRSHGRLVTPFDGLDDPLWHAVVSTRISYRGLPICSVPSIDEIDPYVDLILDLYAGERKQMLLAAGGTFDFLQQFEAINFWRKKFASASTAP
jgi:hypothetical protein